VKDLIQRFSSRKFLVTVSAVTGLLASKNYVEAAGVAIAYVLGEAHIDAKSVAGTVQNISLAVQKAADEQTA